MAKAKAAKQLTPEQQAKREKHARAGRRSKAKGASFEREVRALLRDLWPEAKRGIGQARSAKEVSDVEGTPFWIECKSRKQVSVLDALEQAEEATDGRLPVIVWRERGRAIQVSMRLGVLLAVVRACAIVRGSEAMLPSIQVLRASSSPASEDVPVRFDLPAFKVLVEPLCEAWTAGAGKGEG